jgi:hypothetical protein
MMEGKAIIFIRKNKNTKQIGVVVNACKYAAQYEVLKMFTRLEERPLPWRQQLRIVIEYYKKAATFLNFFKTPCLFISDSSGAA